MEEGPNHTLDVFYWNDEELPNTEHSKKEVYRNGGVILGNVDVVRSMSPREFKGGRPGRGGIEN